MFFDFIQFEMHYNHSNYQYSSRNIPTPTKKYVFVWMAVVLLTSKTRETRKIGGYGIELTKGTWSFFRLQCIFANSHDSKYQNNYIDTIVIIFSFWFTSSVRWCASTLHNVALGKNEKKNKDICILSFLYKSICSSRNISIRPYRWGNLILCGWQWILILTYKTRETKNRGGIGLNSLMETWSFFRLEYIFANFYDSQY